MYIVLLTIFTVLLCALIFAWIKSNSKYGRRDELLGKMRGPKGYPIIGDALYFLGPMEQILPKLVAWCETYGKRFYSRTGPNGYFIILWDPKDIEKVLSSSNHIEKGDDYDFIIPWLGTGLLTSKGEKWFRHRKILTPSFHFRILEDFLPIFNDQSMMMTYILKLKEAEDGNTFNLVPYITRCTLDIICETAMGIKLYAQQGQNSEYCASIRKIGQLIQKRSLSPWLFSDFVWNRTQDGKEQKRVLEFLHGFTEKVIEDRKSKFQKSTDDSGKDEEDSVYNRRRRLAFLDLLLEKQLDPSLNLTNGDIREETDTFMFEGHDTTAANLSFALYAIGCDKKIQKRLDEELESVFGDDRTRPVTLDDLSRLKYVEACLKETLRLFPSVPFIERQLTSELTFDDGVTAPSNIMVFIFIYQLHRDPDLWPDPLTFNPDRFLDDTGNAKNPFAYIPFSAGPRNCIGQKFAMLEGKILLTNFLRHFHIKSQIPLDQIMKSVLAELVIRPRDGLPVKIIPK